MAIGKSVIRVDAADKTNGRANFTGDMVPVGTLQAMIKHSTIANGRVISINTEKAKALKGVEAVFTCFDVPQHVYPTAGHPWSTDPAHQDIADRKLLTDRVRFYGDDIAVVVAETKLIAQEALDLIEVEYEEYEPILTIEDALENKGEPIHETSPTNVLVSGGYTIGDQTYDEAVADQNWHLFEDTYKVPIQQHCFMEGAISYAYYEGKKIVVVTSTQIPHIARRVIGQALDLPWGQFRVIKPYIGGGFGAKQDVLYEPLNAWLTLKTGKPIMLELTREECFTNTRTRHAMKIELKTAFNDEGRMMAIYADIKSNKGAYASHGFSVTANAMGMVKQLLQAEVATEVKASTIYTNLPASGAFRAYGIPQITFALNAHVADVCKKMEWNDIDVIKLNMIKQGWKDPTFGIPSLTNALSECIDKGMEATDYLRKQEEYKNQTGNIRRGVGMAIFSYKTGIYPIGLETAGSRMILNQDGSAQIQVGATEIGQGADTVFTQMASEITGISYDKIYLISTQDTDITPFDTGAYASRQTFVTGHAVRKVAEQFKKNILDYATEFTRSDCHDIEDNQIINRAGEVVMSVGDLAVEAQYSLVNSKHITAEVSNHCTLNSISHGCSFVELEVDMSLGKIKVLDLVSVHDSGRIINPMTARGQVHGGNLQSMAYALSEQMLFNPKTGKPYNNNFLGYKLPTSVDTLDTHPEFIEIPDPNGPFGNKSLGEPPTIAPAPAIRNAVLNATGIAFEELPITSERMFVKFKEAGLI